MSWKKIRVYNHSWGENLEDIQDVQGEFHVFILISVKIEERVEDKRHRMCMKGQIIRICFIQRGISQNKKRLQCKATLLGKFSWG